MRIWDLPPEVLCRKHLLGEHAELHAIWNILTGDMSGYRSHPETRRWEGKLKALYQRHRLLVLEMEKRGYRHFSELDPEKATGKEVQDELLDTVERQKEILRNKHCGCFIDTP